MELLSPSVRLPSRKGGHEPRGPYRGATSVGFDVINEGLLPVERISMCGSPPRHQQPIPPKKPIFPSCSYSRVTCATALHISSTDKASKKDVRCSRPTASGEARQAPTASNETAGMGVAGTDAAVAGAGAGLTSATGFFLSVTSFPAFFLFLRSATSDHQHIAQA